MEDTMTPRTMGKPEARRPCLGVRILTESELRQMVLAWGHMGRPEEKSDGDYY